jgi:NADH-quinone oxidoreductase subunit C
MQIFDVPAYLEAIEAKPRLSTDMPSLTVPVSRLLEAVEAIKQGGQHDLLLDLTAVDWGLEAAVRFSVVYHFYSLNSHSYLRLMVDCESLDQPAVPSIAAIYPAANWHEREAYDMFGISFVGHPDLRRILMWEGYPYYPLRKDFPLAGIEAPLPCADTAEATGETLIPAPMMGGPFYAHPGSTIANREPAGADQSWHEERPKPDEDAPLN